LIQKIYALKLQLFCKEAKTYAKEQHKTLMDFSNILLI